MSNKRTTKCCITLEKLLRCYLRMLVPGNPSCPWGYSDHVTTLVAGNTRAELPTHESGYFFVRHSVEARFLSCQQIEANQTEPNLTYP